MGSAAAVLEQSAGERKETGGCAGVHAPLTEPRDSQLRDFISHLLKHSGAGGARG